jgi:aminoglycoside phosphotransferase (APT) family kinase protein
MSEAKPIVGINAVSVTEWLSAHIADVKPPFEFAVIKGGHSNLTYKVTDSRGRELVLRRPPLGSVLATAHDMGREHKIITGVGQTLVPVPVALGLCSDESVNDAPFYVMSYVDGHVLATADETQKLFPEPASRAKLGESVLATLANLHAVDPDAVGLGDLARKDAYLDRQLKRWRLQWENSKTRELPAMEEVYESLIAAKPEQKYTGIVHGDFRLGNMLSTADSEIAAVLDWELCTLGDTLADVGYLLNNWSEPGDERNGVAATAPTASGGFATRRELIDRYAELTGHEVSNVNYYRSFQSWRLAAITEGVLSRYLKGVMADSTADTNTFRIATDGLANEALRLIRKLD